MTLLKTPPLHLAEVTLTINPTHECHYHYLQIRENVDWQESQTHRLWDGWNSPVLGLTLGWGYEGSRGCESTFPYFAKSNTFL